MSSWTLIGLAVAGGVVVAAAAVVAMGARRRRAGSAEHQGPPLTRRELILRGTIGVFVAALSGVVASAIAFIWPNVSGHRGARYVVGRSADLRARLAADRRPYIGGNGRFYLVAFPPDRLAEARRIYPAAVLAGMEEGLVALSPVCTHQGCHVPYCASSAWFECPCHGSRYDTIGEQRRGPAPRGLDHYAVIVAAGVVTVDTKRTYLGPPPGTVTLDDPPAGPHCY